MPSISYIAIDVVHTDTHQKICIYGDKGILSSIVRYAQALFPSTNVRLSPIAKSRQVSENLPPRLNVVEPASYIINIIHQSQTKGAFALEDFQSPARGLKGAFKKISMELLTV